MKWALLLTLALALVLFQTSTASAFVLFGVGPHLLLVALCCWTVVRPPEETMFLAPVCGIGMGLLSHYGLLESVIALAPLGLAAIWWSARETAPQPVQDWLAALSLVAAATTFHFAVHAAAVEIADGAVAWPDALRDVLLRNLMANLIVAAVCYWLVRLPTRPRRLEEAGAF